MTAEEIDRFIKGGVKHGTLAKCVYEIASGYIGADHEAFVCDVFTRAIHAAERALLERLVPEVCDECHLGKVPKRGTVMPEDQSSWNHAADSIFGEYCPASPLHELLREMDDA